METIQEIEMLEKLIGQLKGLHTEIGALAKKSPNDAVNSFKLKLVNKILEMGSTVLGEKYKPFEGFDNFEEDDAPSTSDVTMVVAQFIEEAERYRSDNVKWHGGRWRYILNGQPSEVESGPPTKIGRK